MRNNFVMLTIGFTVAFSLVARAAEKPTPEFVKAMKDLIGVVQTMTKPDAATDFELATKSSVTAKAAFAVVKKYWDTGNDLEAIKLSDASVKAAGELGISSYMSSAEGIAAAVKDLRATCAPCHMAHRTELADKTFEIK